MSNNQTLEVFVNNFPSQKRPLSNNMFILEICFWPKSLRQIKIKLLIILKTKILIFIKKKFFVCRIMLVEGVLHFISTAQHMALTKKPYNGRLILFMFSNYTVSGKSEQARHAFYFYNRFQCRILFADGVLHNAHYIEKVRVGK